MIKASSYGEDTKLGLKTVFNTVIIKNNLY